MIWARETPRLRLAFGVLLLTAIAIASARVAAPAAAEPCKDAHAQRAGHAALPGAGAKVELFPTTVRPYRFPEADKPGGDTDPSNADSILCVCSVCGSSWLDRLAPRKSVDTATAESIAQIGCDARPAVRGYLIGGLGDKKIITVERTERTATLRWLDVGRGRVAKELSVGRKDEFLGGGALASDEGDGIVAGERVLFTNATGLLREYPDRVTLQGTGLKGFYSAETGRGILDIGGTRYAAVSSPDGVVYRPFVAGSDPEQEMRPRSVRRIWASEHWILKNIGPYPSLWMASETDGSNEQFLAYGGLAACGQPLMDDYALNVQSDNGYSVMALSLRSGQPDRRISGVPLDRVYCVAGDRGLIAVTGRDDERPAVAIYRDGAWQRIFLPDSQSLLEPLVDDGRVFVSAPEEMSLGNVHGSLLSSVGAVYVLKRHDATWNFQAKVVPSTSRPHALFGYKIVPLGNRLYINFLDDQPRAKHKSADSIGYPSVCHVDLPEG